MQTIQNLMIALPTVSRTFKNGTAITLANTVKALEARGIKTTIRNIDSAEIVTARDMFANMLLHNDQWDGLLFIDSDMAFSPRLALKLVDEGVPLAAAACPRRTLHLERFSASLNRHGQIARAKAEASDFTVHFSWSREAQTRLEIRNGFCSAAAAGMAIALISRDCIKAMVEGGVVGPRRDLSSTSGQKCWSFFSPIEHEGRRLGEDYSFCHRWTKQLGRELRVCLDEEVTHIGDFDYSARYIDLLASSAASEDR